MISNLSLLGLYSFDNSIFDGLYLPSGMDKATFIDELLMETAELEVIYPDADFMKGAISRWSTTMQGVWNKLYATTVLEYNPIWNKDGKITEIEGIHKQSEGSRDNTGKEQNNGVATTEADGGSTSEHKVAAFNEQSDYSNSTYDENDSTTKGRTLSAQSVANENNEEYSDKDDTERTYQRIEQGNIGVTTTQQMITEEREVALYNLYAEIIKQFKRRFCLLVY